MIGLAASLALLVGAAASAPAKPQGVALTDGRILAEIAGGQYGTPYWSPDDQWLAFKATRSGPAPKAVDPKKKPPPPPKSDDVYVCRADGTGLKRIYEPPAAGLTVIGPDWVGRHVLFGLKTREGTMLRACSLDGKRVYSGEFGPYLVFGGDTLLVSRDDGIYRVDVGKGAEQVITAAPPAGQVFSDLAAPADLSYLVARLGRHTHLLFPDKSAVVVKGLTLAEPSPDGRYLVGHVPVISPSKIRVTVGAVLYRVDAAARTVEKVRDLLPSSEYLGGWATMRPWWSADSTRVEFVATPIASEGRPYRHWYLHHADVPDGAVRRVQDIEAYSHKTEASRDGRWTIIWRKFDNRGEWLVLRGKASYRKTDRYLMGWSNDISHDGTRLAGRMRDDGKLWVFTLTSLAERPTP